MKIHPTRREFLESTGFAGMLGISGSVDPQRLRGAADGESEYGIDLETSNGEQVASGVNPLRAGEGCRWTTDDGGGATLDVTASGGGLPTQWATLEQALAATDGSASNPADVAAALKHGITNGRVLLITQEYTTDTVTVSSGAETIRIAGGGTLIWSGNGGKRLLSIESGSHVVVENVGFDGNHDGHGSQSRLVEFTNCARVDVENCFFTDNGEWDTSDTDQRHCLNVLGASGARIVGSRFFECGGKAINMYADPDRDHDQPFGVTAALNVIIRTAEECIFIGNEDNGSSMPEKTTYLVVGNHMEANQNQNAFRASNESINDTMIGFNTIHQANGFSAMNLKTGEQSDVQPGTASTNVISNKILIADGSADHAISVQGTGGGAPGGVITDNVCWDAPITLESGPQNWRIKGNYGTKITAKSGRGYIITGNDSDVEIQDGVSNYLVKNNLGSVTDSPGNGVVRDNTF